MPHRNAYDVERVAVLDLDGVAARKRPRQAVEEHAVRQVDARVGVGIGIGSLVHFRLMFAIPVTPVLTQMA